MTDKIRQALEAVKRVIAGGKMSDYEIREYAPVFLAALQTDAGKEKIIWDGELDFAQATKLLECFGGEEATLRIAYWVDAHSGEGLYAYHPDYPEDGAIYLGISEDQKILSDYRKTKATPPQDVAVKMGENTLIFQPSEGGELRGMQDVASTEEDDADK